jgi:ubiquinone/menaquinone biosynthesis C-methylase UbiE
LIQNVLTDCVGDPRRLQVLDIGCGIGLVDQTLSGDVAELWGVDTSLHSLEIARARDSTTRFVHYDGVRLPFGDSVFDAVFTSCVLHHVPPPARRYFAQEMLRAVRDGGAVIVIEHNPANPITQRVVARCEFDADAVLLSCRETMRLITDAGAAVMGRRYVGFSPFRSALVERAERLIGWLPIGAQYCVWGIKASLPAFQPVRRPIQ